MPFTANMLSFNISYKVLHRRFVGLDFCQTQNYQCYFLCPKTFLIFIILNLVVLVMQIVSLLGPPRDKSLNFEPVMTRVNY